MESIKKYWFLIAFFIAFVGDTAVAAYRLSAIEQAVSDHKDSASKSDVGIILQIKTESKEIKAEAEKMYSEAKRERQALEAEQKKTTVLEVNQTYLIKGVGDLNSALKDLANEIREMERRRK